MKNINRTPARANDIHRNLRILQRRLKQEQEEFKEAKELAARAQLADAKKSFTSIQKEAERNMAKIEQPIDELKQKKCSDK